MKVVEFEGVANARDFGGVAAADGRVIPHGLFYRGGALAKATDRDIDTLAYDLGVSCVVDVRCGWERAEKPSPEVPGAENLHIPFYDKDIVGIEYLEPAEGTKVVGRDVACDPVRFYRSLANPLTVGQMRRALSEIFARTAHGLPVYLHCSGGKDRSGVLAALVLYVLGASWDDILSDYLFTNVSHDKRFDEHFRRFLRFADGDEARARELTVGHRARPENLAAFREAVRERYGSFDAFVEGPLGIDAPLRAFLRDRCTVAAGDLHAKGPTEARDRGEAGCAVLDFRSIGHAVPLRELETAVAMR